MPKYKFKKNYKTLIQLYLFYYFINAIKVYECQQMSNDVEFIIASRPENRNVNDFHKKTSDSEYVYQPIDGTNNLNFNDELDDSKNVNLNVNNNLPHDGDHPVVGGDESRYTEIHEDRISGQKVLYSSESPYLLRQDLEILQNAQLVIEPGVKIHFAPMVGITVHGAIKAIVSIYHLFNKISRIK